jgi:HAD superfamily hydrolase (TIGR01509 family)
VNVVFDLGGVVFTWSPEAILRDRFPDPDIRDAVRREIFRHPDWQALDRGTLPRGEAVERAAGRTGLAVGEISDLMHSLPEALQPIPETVDLLHRVRAAGHRLYCLSNMHRDVIEVLEERNTFWHLFDGRVLSCRVQWIKPEPEIYAHLLEAHGLEAAETVFIDDMQVNLDAAGDCGIQGVLFQSPTQCEGALQSLGIL